MSFYDDLVRLSQEPEDIWVKNMMEAFGPRIKSNSTGHETKETMEDKPKIHLVKWEEE